MAELTIAINQETQLSSTNTHGMPTHLQIERPAWADWDDASTSFQQEPPQTWKRYTQRLPGRAAFHLQHPQAS
jgi:hypothetical protein